MAGWIVITLFVLLVVCLALFNIPAALYSYNKKKNAVKDIAGWPTHWLWGNLHQIVLNETFLLKWSHFIQSNRLKLTKTWLGPFHTEVAIHHCELARKVLKEPKHKEPYRLILPWLGDGLLISQGKKWFRNRRLLTPAFHYEILKPYIRVYSSCLQAMLTKWSTAEKEHKPVKLFETISLLSLDIILQCAFTFKSNCQSSKESHPYIKAVQDLVHLSSQRYVVLYQRIDWLYYLTPSGRRYKEKCRIVHEYSDMVIRERKAALGLDGPDADRDAALKKANEQRKYLDFLDILLTAADQDGKGLSDLEIRDEADTFMFEGHDTTTSGMCWTLYCLAKHPEHQEKVREEVKSVLMGRELLEYEDLKDLKYTHWCIKEAMRLYPPVFFIFRQASEDLELDGHVIPKGMQVGISIRNIHRHPDIWENPNDFDPLRFHPSNVEGRDPYAYIPFSAGYRNCIGQNFALNEERLIVASLVLRFRLSLVEGHKVEMLPTVVLRAANDIAVNLESIMV